MKKYIVYYKKDIIFYLFLMLIVLSFHCVFINAYIPSASMENTLKTHDRIIGNKLATDYNRGDIAIFKYDDSTYYIKRIMGVAGDTIAIRNNKVYVNGKELYEPYIKESMKSEDYKFIVPENSYFFLGDNRNDSSDSRFWDNPFRTKNEIVAKAIFRYWPINKCKIIK